MSTQRKIILISILAIGIGFVIMATDDHARCADAQNCQQIVYPRVQGFPTLWWGPPQYGHTGNQYYNIPYDFGQSWPAGTTHHFCFLTHYGVDNSASGQDADCRVYATSWSDTSDWQMHLKEDNKPNVECRAACVSW